MSSRSDRTILIGVDGGASRVRAHEVWVEAGAGRLEYRLAGGSAIGTYPAEPFEPVSLARQIEEQAAGRISVTDNEMERGQVVAATIAGCVIELLRNIGAPLLKKVRLGIGMPGLKTPDSRGIAVINNGPRIPDLADRIEAGLSVAGLDLAEPIRRIGGDGNYCGLGEQYAADGLFRDVENAYYVGGGTGLAEALKLRGVLLPFDNAGSWIAKAWQMRSIRGPTFEQLASARAINLLYARNRASGTWTDAVPVNVQGRPLDPQYPEAHALQGDPAALQVLETAADALAELIFERVDTVYRGRLALGHRGADYARLVPGHEYRGLFLERVILGQQTGRLYGDPQMASVFADKLNRFLAERILADEDSRLANYYLKNDSLRSGVVVPSRLSAAAALGAAIDADRGCA